MKSIYTILLPFTFCLTFQSVTFAQTEKEVEAIKEVILEGYVHGAFNELNPDAMRKTFHEDFAIYSPKGEAIAKYPIDTWASGVEKRKGSTEFDPEKNIWKHKFVSVDVTGNAAAVKIELYKDGKHVYTDYLSLLLFDSGWRVVAKVYSQHS